MRVEIPSIFLKQTNELKAHCWDTDKVESGFMAGLYVVESRGLHPLLLTDDNIWSTAEGFAEVRFYSNSVPDIPEAEVFEVRVCMVKFGSKHSLVCLKLLMQNE